jgi:hypothetical protein
MAVSIKPYRPIAAVLLLTAAGCGNGDGLNYAEVGGTVKFGGKPLPGVVVEYYPVVAAGQPALPASRGQTDDSGRYQLTCVNQKAGAVVGQHRVVVRRPPQERDPDAAPKQVGPVIPVAYTVAADTPLRVEVSPQKSVYNLDLTRR